jgi:hypothetical protein
MKPMLTACSVVARNYLPYARVLADSLHEHHADVRLVVLVLDLPPECDARSESFEAIRPGDLGLQHEDVAAMTAIYDAKEVATAFKPALIRKLLDEGMESVLFLDPDILVTASLDDLWRLSAEHGVTLIPHSLAPFPADGRTPTDRPIRRAGIYNGGYVGVGRIARPFLDWWEDRLRLHAIFDKSEGLFVDQRWLDFVPSYFPYLILRDPTIDVAYWNLHDRNLTRDGNLYLIDGQPLRFFHFSGFNPLRPQLLTRVANRFVAAGHPALEPLCEEYAALLLDAGYAEYIGLDYAPEAGKPAGRLERRLRREALMEAGGQIGAAADGQRLDQPGSASARARAYLAVGPKPVEFSSRLGLPGRMLQRFTLRLVRPFADQQALVDRALLEVIDDREAALRAEIAVLEARITALKSSITPST